MTSAPGIAHTPWAGRPGGAACNTCPARHGKYVPSEPARNAHRLTVIGDAPTYADLDESRPFAGKAGRMLARGLATLGLARGNVHWTNAALCSCPERERGAAAKACGARLAAELDGLPVAPIVTMGAAATQHTLGLPRRPEILKWRGSVSRRGASLVLPTLHPTFVGQALQWGPVLETDIERVGRYVDGAEWLPPEESRKPLIVPHTPRELTAALAELAPGATSFDVETVGLGPMYTSLVCFGFSDGATTVVVPWSRARDGREPWWDRPARVAAEVSRMLATRVMVTHNGPGFDHIVAQRYGIRWRAWEDTLLWAHAHRGHLPKNLAQVVTTTPGLDVPPWKQLEDRTATIERLWHYNGRDCLYTALAWQGRNTP